MTTAQVTLYGVHRMNGSVRHQRNNSHFIWYHRNRAINFTASSNAQSQTDPGARPATATISAADAQQRGVETGEVIRIFNDRGACLARANVSTAFFKAWYHSRPVPGMILRVMVPIARAIPMC
ncbi:MAG: hypothetical protein Ct9H300mP16_17560 [Pseudomonadota bacterium]|nr:MAG: hypothetical protein Ct9H300mP16_17560 [Pseudomonadota bacterium]